MRSFIDDKTERREAGYGQKYSTSNRAVSMGRPRTQRSPPPTMAESPSKEMVHRMKDMRSNRDMESY